MSKLEFKEFVKKHTELIKTVDSGNTTWQHLYELYDLYGENSNIWNQYLKNTSNESNSFNNVGNTFKELVNLIKGVDLNTVQKGLTSLDKAIETFKDILPNTKTKTVENYEPSPNYKYFED